MERKTGDIWELRKRGWAGVVSSAPNCGYDMATLESLQRHGYSLYKNGEKVVFKDKTRRAKK